ncbi:hypothetical protein ACWEOZ_04435 [Actinoplanes sp. NPDC004185]
MFQQQPRPRPVQPGVAHPVRPAGGDASEPIVEWTPHGPVLRRSPGHEFAVPEGSPAPPAPAKIKKVRERPAATAWVGAAEAVDRIREYATAERLDRALEAALRLRDRLAESRAEAGDGAPRPARLVRTLIAARDLARELDVAESLGVLPSERRDRLDQQLARLAGCLGTEFEQVAAPTREPKWLDVASPAHDQVNVAGARTFFRPGHVTATDAAAVVVANDCKLESVDHYHLRRVSLDCASLYRDAAALDAFAAMVAEPTEASIQDFRDQLRRIAEPVPESGPRSYRERVAARVNTHLDHPDVAVLGDESQVRSATRYHVHETVVPLVDLLHQDEDLVRALAAGPDGPDRGQPIMDVLGRVDDSALLRYAMSGEGEGVTVRRSPGARRVDLAAAVMVGAGNTLTHRSEVEAGPAGAGNLATFDRLVGARREQVRRAAERSAGRKPRP